MMAGGNMPRRDIQLADEICPVLKANPTSRLLPHIGLY